MLGGRTSSSFSFSPFFDTFSAYILITSLRDNLTVSWSNYPPVFLDINYNIFGQFEYSRKQKLALSKLQSVGKKARKIVQIYGDGQC